MESNNAFDLSEANCFRSASPSFGEMVSRYASGLVRKDTSQLGFCFLICSRYPVTQCSSLSLSAPETRSGN